MKPPLANLFWMSPLWALGLIAAISIPLLAHLLNQRRRRTLVFPATELLRESLVHTRRLQRPRHLFLMSLRVLALALIVFGFMRPVWHRHAQARPPADGQTLVIVIDASASMQRVTDGRRAFDQAKDQAGRLLDQLEPGQDRASIVLLTDRLEPLLPEPSGNLSELRRRLALARCTWQADRPERVGDSLADALREHGPFNAAWISDGQHPKTIAAAHKKLTESGLLLGFEGVSAGQPVANASVHLQDIQPYAPVANQPFEVTVRLRYNGAKPAQRTLILTVADQQRLRQVSLEPGTDQLLRIALDGLDDAPAQLSVGFEQPDAFAQDDRTGIKLRPLSYRRVLVWTDESDGPSAARIRSMLSPRADLGPAARRGLQVTAVDDPQDLTGLDPSSTLVLTGLARSITAEARQQVVEHLERGGGVVWITDTEASRRAMKQINGPLQFDDRVRRAQTLRETRINFDAPEMRVFEGASRGMLAQVSWPGFHQATGSERARGLISGPEGTPVLLAQSYGRGTLYALNCDLAAERFALSLDPAFVVLFNELVGLAAAGQALAPPVHPGQAVTIHGESTRLLQPGPAATDRWVELDPSESDLFTGTTQEQAIASGVMAGSNAWSVGNLPTAGTALWPYLLLGALALFAVEAGALLRYQFADRRGGDDA
ncbi:MAG: BatA and WFA domain-containing protein [Planctomycetota bacterium]